MNSTLILCTYMYENSQQWANTLVKVCKNRDDAFNFAMSTLNDNLSYEHENDCIYDLLADKTDAETEETTISTDAGRDHIELEYDVGWFRLTLWDETHVCRYDTIVEWLVVELS